MYPNIIIIEDQLIRINNRTLVYAAESGYLDIVKFLCKMKL